VVERVAGEDAHRRHLCARRGWSFIGIWLGEILLAFFREGQVNTAHVESGAKQHLLDEMAVVTAAATTTSAASITSSGRITAIATACVHLASVKGEAHENNSDCLICPS
jgi:hypothetical protein